MAIKSLRGRGGPFAPIEPLEPRLLLSSDLGSIPFSQRVIDEAFEVPLIDFEQAPLDASDDWWTKWDNGTGDSALKTSEILLFLSLVSHLDGLDPSVSVISGGKTAAQRTIEHLEHLVSGGAEPRAGGGIYGWADGPAAAGIAVARLTPEIWDNLGLATRDKLDWVMKSLAIGAHWSLDNYHDWTDRFLLLDNTDTFSKAYAPNHWWGQVPAIVSAVIYFDGANGLSGADYLNQHVFGAAFDKADYIAAFNQHGFTNLLDTWRIDTATMNQEIHNRGTHDFGVGLSSGGPWGPQRGLDDLLAYVESPIEKKGFNGTVQNGSTATNPDSTLLSGSSPWLGQHGQINEFDRGSGRSSARYSYDDWRSLIPLRVVLEVAGQWDRSDSTVDEALEGPFAVGSEDLIYKLNHGYVGFANGEVHGPHWNFEQQMGYNWVVDMWRHYLEPGLAPNRDASGIIEAESFDVSTQGQYNTSNDTLDNSNTRNVVNAEGATGRIITAIRSGEWTIYDDVDFGSGVDMLRLSVASGGGATLSVHWFDDVTRQWRSAVADHAIGNTGGLASYATQDIPLSEFITGVHRLRLTFNGSGTELANVDWMQFEAADMTPPDAPVAVTAVGSINSVSLDWPDSSEADLAGYNVYRTLTSGGPLIQLSSSPVTHSTYQDTAVTEGTSYDYFVSAVDISGNESELTGPATAVPLSSSVLPGAVSRYSFDSDASDSIGSNHGRFVRNAAITSDSLTGAGALSLNGVGQYVTIDGVADDVLGDELTFAGWVNAQGKPRDQQAVFAINDKHGGNKLLLMLGRNHRSDYDGRLAVHDETTSGWWLAPSDVRIDDGAWHHFAVTKAGTQAALYIDGQLQYVWTTAVTLDASDLWSVGQEWDSFRYSDALGGRVDDVQIYDRALNTEEVQTLAGAISSTTALMSQTSMPPPPPEAEPVPIVRTAEPGQSELTIDGVDLDVPGDLVQVTSLSDTTSLAGVPPVGAWFAASFPATVSTRFSGPLLPELIEVTDLLG